MNVIPCDSQSPSRRSTTWPDDGMAAVGYLGRALRSVQEGLDEFDDPNVPSSDADEQQPSARGLSPDPPLRLIERRAVDVQMPSEQGRSVLRRTDRTEQRGHLTGASIA